MKQLLVDTNIVIDLLSKREGFYNEAAELFSLADRKQVKLAVSALTLANTNYILSKFTNAKRAREILRKFNVLVRILDLNRRIIDLALSDVQFTDFEDGIQYYTAMENSIDAIITRNKRDFRTSEIPTFTAQEYLAQWEQGQQ